MGIQPYRQYEEVMISFLSSCFLANDTEDSEGLPSLEKPGWYSQGNWPHLQQLLKAMTGKAEPKVNQSGQFETARPERDGRTASWAHFEVDLNFWQRLNGTSALGDSRWCEAEEQRGSWQGCAQSGCVPASCC